MRQSKILLVEDQAPVRITINKILSDGDFIVEQCSSGNQAKEILETQNFDLVITDLRMRDGTGYDLIRHIEEIPQSANGKPGLIIITGAHLLEVEEEMRQKLESDYFVLHKPFSKEDLLDSVTLALAQQQRMNPWAGAP